MAILQNVLHQRSSRNARILWVNAVDISFFIPAVTMKLWAEEKKIGTAEILMTLPLRDYEVVVGKFLASFGLLAVTALFSLALPLCVIILGIQMVEQ